MKKSNKLYLVFGYIALTSGCLWFGAYVARLLITYQMFQAEELILKTYISDVNLPGIIQTTFPLVNLTFFSYLTLIVSFTIFLIFNKLKLKNNGWLMIITLIIYLTLPFEFILLIIDYKLIILFLNDQFASEKILSLIIERITELNSFPVILILSYLSIPYFLVFKPFRMELENEN